MKLPRPTSEVVELTRRLHLLRYSLRPYTPDKIRVDLARSSLSDREMLAAARALRRIEP